MPLTTPRFWYQRRRGWPAWLLWPLGWLYGAAVTLHRGRTRRWRCSVPVLSIGNLTLGGTGKTPLGIALAQGLEQRGWRVAVLLRGYGTRRRNPCLVSATSSYAEVGDEALEYAQSLGDAVAWVGSNRCRSAELAVAAGATLILLDDGLQHWRIDRDLDLSLLDRKHALGNHLVFPAGPLREPLDQLARADALVFTGAEPVEPLPPIPVGWPSHKPRFAVRFCLVPPPQLQQERLVAFCGIGLPEKFFSALRVCGLQLVATEAFPDHHVYAESDLERLLELAHANGARLVTTVKDGHRLPHRYRQVVSLVPLQVDDVSLAPLLNWLDQRLGALSGVRFDG